MLNIKPVEELKSIVENIEGKKPTDMPDYYKDKVQFLKDNGVHDRLHVGRTEWTKKQAAEWLLGMFVGIHDRAQQNELFYNNLGPWLEHAYHFVINNVPKLDEE